MERVVIVSDLHSGTRAGLTPPKWQYPATGSGGDRDKFAELQAKLWNWWATEIEKLKPIDHFIINGDAIDGKGTRSGGTEQITLDRIEQGRMAIEACKISEAKNYHLTYGTSYHNGIEEDLEDNVAKGLGGDIQSILRININGLAFAFRHHLSSSSVPYGRHGASAKHAVWGMLHAMREGREPDRVFVCSHVHYFQYAGDITYLTMSTPALSGPGSKFGERIMDGTTDSGFVVFDIEDKDRWTWKPVLFTVR
jgi:hypothetical protein